MIGALCASACFLTGYLIRVSTQGTQTFSGGGALKVRDKPTEKIGFEHL